MKKYVCCSGNIISQNDGDIHFIPASRLPQLYGVKKEECYFPVSGELYKDFPDGLIPLYPRSDGNYSLEDAIKRSKESNGDYYNRLR